MRMYFVTFRSVTYAQRGERVLRAAGISSVLQRAPRSMEERGCGYRLSLRQGDAETAVALLRQARVEFRKVYFLRQDGTLEEVAL